LVDVIALISTKLLTSVSGDLLASLAQLWSPGFSCSQQLYDVVGDELVAQLLVLEMGRQAT
jgi:hypothetical protein